MHCKGIKQHVYYTPTIHTIALHIKNKRITICSNKHNFHEHFRPLLSINEHGFTIT